MSDRNEKLGIIVEATDHASGKLANVKREIAGIGNAAAGSRFGGFVSSIQQGASKIKSSLGGAFSHAKGQLLGLLKTPLAGLGIGLGLAGIAKFFSDSVGDAFRFGEAVEKVAKSTGLAVPVASSMVDTFEKWGIDGDKLSTILGRLNNNTYKIVNSAKDAKKFQDQFGVSLVNSKGKIADANTLLLRSADYFNSNATASQKAAFLQKLYGKSWQDLIPILAKGSKAIKEEEANSLKLTQQQLDDITKYRTAARDFGDELGDLKVKIGATLMPLLSEGLRGLGDWISTHSDQVVQFVKDAAGAARGVIGSVMGTLGTIKTAWDGIPDPVKDLLIKGVAAERTIKFLFGISVTDVVGGLVKGVAGGLGNAFVQAGLGKAFVQPVFVTNPGFGAGGGALPGAAGAGGAGAAAGGLGFLGVAALAGLGAGMLALAYAINPTDPLKQRTPEMDAAHLAGRSWNPSFTARERAISSVPQRVALTERQEAILSHQAATMDALERNRLNRATQVTVKNTTNVKVSVSTRSIGGALKSQTSFASSTNTNRTGGAVDEGELW